MIDSNKIYWGLRTYKGYLELFSNWNWEWFTTLTIPNSYSFETAMRKHLRPKWTKQLLEQENIPARYYFRSRTDMVKKLRLGWTRTLCTEEELQIAYYFVCVYSGNFIHLHLLMLGRNKYGKTLADVPHKGWEWEWPFLAQIDIPRELEGVSKYVAGHLYKNVLDHVEIDCYNTKLLKKLKG